MYVLSKTEMIIALNEMLMAHQDDRPWWFVNAKTIVSSLEASDVNPRQTPPSPLI